MYNSIKSNFPMFISINLLSIFIAWLLIYNSHPVQYSSMIPIDLSIIVFFWLVPFIHHFFSFCFLYPSYIGFSTLLKGQTSFCQNVPSMVLNSFQFWSCQHHPKSGCLISFMLQFSIPQPLFMAFRVWICLSFLLPCFLENSTFSKELKFSIQNHSNNQPNKQNTT